MKLGDLSVESRDGIVYATIAGDVDMSNVQQLREALGRATSNQAMGLVLDLSDVDYLDSAGIHLIHTLHSNLRSHGQKLALIIPPGSVINDALRLAGMDWGDKLISAPEEAHVAFGDPAARRPAAEAGPTSADG